MGRMIINIVLIVLMVLLTVFGLGPAFFADGTSTERMYTLLVVTFLYLLLGVIMLYVNKRMKK